VPADVGISLGVGVVAPIPTQAYTGPIPITVPGTVVENVIVNETLRIEADNVTVRNCIIDQAASGIGQYSINVERGDNVLIEYNKLINIQGGKHIRISSDCDAGVGNCPGAGNATNVTVRRNESIGGLDFMWINETNGLLVEDNYVHAFNPSSGGHVDGFQTSAGLVGVGSTITIRGNYFNHEYVGDGYNSIYFIGGYYTVIFESNYMWPWLDQYHARIWPNREPFTVYRYNVYDMSMAAHLAAGSHRRWVHYKDGGATNATNECNRYADGSFMPQARMGGDYVEHVITGCPSYPP
jgi:hypothetical protein